MDNHVDSLLVEDAFDWKTAKDIKVIYELPFAKTIVERSLI